MERTVGLSAIVFLFAPALSGQQTIFNVPSADILARGKFYVETDWLWRPVAPRFATGAVRGVYGPGNDLEVGVNVGGLNPAARSAVDVVPNVKWQPHSSDSFSLSTGGFGSFPVAGPGDRIAAGLGFAHAAWKLPTGTRVTAGGWLASAHYAGPDAQGGGLFAIEQTIVTGLTLAADWYTGGSSLGYATPGLILSQGRWVLYAGYAFKNGDARGSGLLLELGYTP